MRPITQQVPLKHRPRPHCALSNLFCIWLSLPSIQKGNFNPFLFFSSPPPFIFIPLHTYTDTHTPPSTTELGVIIINLQEMKLKNESQSREDNWVKYDDDTQEATWQNQKYTLRAHPHPLQALQSWKVYLILELKYTKLREVPLGWPPTPLHLDGLIRCCYYLSMCSSLQCHKVICETKIFFSPDHYFFNALYFTWKI